MIGALIQSPVAVDRLRRSGRTAGGRISREPRARVRYALGSPRRSSSSCRLQCWPQPGASSNGHRRRRRLRLVVASPGVRDFNAPFTELWVDPADDGHATAQPQCILLRCVACGIRDDCSAARAAVARR